jgi:CHAT domain-containing protein/Tfp pilus assembly protein PilF
MLAPAGFDIAQTLNTLGLIGAKKGDLARADSYFYQSLSIKQDLSPESMDVAGTLSNIGNVAMAQDDLEKAGEYFHHSLKILLQLAPDSLGTAYVLNNLGMLACMRGDQKAAETYLREALDLKNKLAPESITVAASISNLADIFKDRGELEKADEYFRKALAIEDKLSPNGSEVAMTLHSLGELWAQQQDLAKAEDYFRKELAIWEKLAPSSKSHADTLAALASVLRHGQPELAAHLYGQALDALETQVAHLGGSENVVRDFRAKHADYYSEYIDLLVQQKQPIQAFAVLERSRARVLLETLTTGHINIRNGVDPSLLSLEQSLLAEITSKSNRKIELLNEKPGGQHIARLDSEVTELLSQYQEVQEKIRFSSPAYAALTQPRILSIEEVQQILLDSDTCLLEYSLGEERSYVFVVTTGSLAVFTLPRRSEIELLARAVYETLTARNHFGKENDRRAHDLWMRADAKSANVAAQLSDMILGPVGPLLSKYKRLLVVPDGLLQYIPIAALPTPWMGSAPEVAMQKRRHPTMRAAAPLVLEHEIVILPSASVMSELRREEQNRAQPSGAIAVLADPVFDARDPRVTKELPKHAPRSTVQQVRAYSGLSDLSLRRNDLTRSASEMGFSDGRELTLKRLDYTRQEAKSILAVTHGKTLKALDFDASRETAISPSLAQYRFIHFATHGILNSKHPELSGLIFSMVDKHGRPQQGFLSLQDVYDMALPVDLVVLSGCETGLGKEIRSEGLIGLTRGFMYAGSSRVVASLWSISDQATAELMAAFYRRMERDKESPAAALRAAQIEMWRKDIWKSPYYWAAFQIHGEWK